MGGGGRRVALGLQSKKLSQVEEKEVKEVVRCLWKTVTLSNWYLKENETLFSRCLVTEKPAQIFLIGPSNKHVFLIGVRFRYCKGIL